LLGISRKWRVIPSIFIVFIFVSMTIDLTSPTFSITPRSDYSIYDSFFGKAIMNFNHLGYTNNDGFEFKLSADTSNERYYKFTLLDLTSDDLSFDVGGYYKFELWGVIDGEDYFLDSFLVKIINNFNWSEATEFISNNEDNKQFTYFRE
jgi:hypothetical protein